MSQKTLIDKQTILLQIKDVMFSSALAGAQCWLLMLHVPYWPSNLLFSAVLTLFHWGSIYLCSFVCRQRSMQSYSTACYPCPSSRSKNEISERATLSIM